VVLAQVFTAAGRLHDALTLLDGVAREAVASENLQATRGDILSRMGRGAEAERAFREEIRMFPQNLDAWSKLAVLYVTEGRLAAARTAIETMVRLNPGPRSRRVAAATFEAVELPREAARWR
jgi:Flp pilus assembly protein TadD